MDDNVNVWRIQVSSFAGTPAGKLLNRDLAMLACRFGADYDHVLLEVSMAKDYPTSPPAMRVVRPRMVPYTGALGGWR